MDSGTPISAGETKPNWVTNRPPASPATAPLSARLKLLYAATSKPKYAVRCSLSRTARRAVPIGERSSHSRSPYTAPAAASMA